MATIYAEESCTPSVGDYVQCDPAANENIVIVSLPFSDPASPTFNPGESIRVSCVSDVTDPLGIAIVRALGTVTASSVTSPVKVNGISGGQVAVPPFAVLTCTWLGPYSGWSVQ